MSAYEKAARAQRLQNDISSGALDIRVDDPEKGKRANERIVVVHVRVKHEALYGVQKPSEQELDQLGTALHNTLWRLRGGKIAHGVIDEMQQHLDGLRNEAEAEAILSELGGGV